MKKSEGAEQKRLRVLSVLPVRLTAVIGGMFMKAGAPTTVTPPDGGEGRWVESLSVPRLLAVLSWMGYTARPRVQ